MKKGSKKLMGAWYNMHYRCSNPRCKDYKDYGAKGIKVCERWYDVDNFIADMGEPEKDMSLDRSDTYGDYTPDNCKWSTLEEQNRNRERNVKGYTWNKYHKKYEAKIKMEGKRLFLGYFDCKEAARRAYLEARSTYFQKRAEAI